HTPHVLLRIRRSSVSGRDLMVKSAPHRAASDNEGRGFHFCRRTCQPKSRALDSDSDVAAQMGHKIPDTRRAELQRTYAKRLKRKPGCFDRTVAENDCRSRGEGERVTDALYAEIYRRNGITSEVEAMYLHTRDQENATAQIPISC